VAELVAKDSLTAATPGESLLPDDAMSCPCLPSCVCAPAGSAAAMDDGSQCANRKGRTQEPDSCGKYAERLGDLGPRIAPGKHGEMRNDIDSPWNPFASLFISAAV